MLTLFALVLVIGTVVDDARCKRNGISPSDVLSTLSGYIGGNYASNMNRFSKLYRVMVQAPPEYRLDIESLNNIFVRNEAGEMSPVSQYLTLTRVFSSEILTRFNLFSSIQVNGSPGHGLQLGTGHRGGARGSRRNPPDGLRLRIRRHVARGVLDG